MRAKKDTPHTVDLDEMLAWIEREEVVAASSSSEPKRLCVRLAGGYRVELRGETIYAGTDGRTAVTRYNEAQ
jgi:hypothetical protein